MATLPLQPSATGDADKMADSQLGRREGDRLNKPVLVVALCLQTFKPEKVKCRKARCFLLFLMVACCGPAAAGPRVFAGSPVPAEEPSVPAGQAEEGGQGQPCPSILLGKKGRPNIFTCFFRSFFNHMIFKIKSLDFFFFFLSVCSLTNDFCKLVLAELTTG